MAQLNGIITALLTPFDESGTIIRQGLKQLVDHVISNGSDGLYVNGSTAQSFLCELKVREQILRDVADAADGRVPMVAQVGSLVHSESRYLIDVAADCGYDYISAVTPFYYKFSFDEILDYYKQLLHPDLPMIIYIIPALTGTVLNVSQISELMDLGNVMGIKYTSTDMLMLERLRKAFPSKTILSGYDEIMINSSVLGVDGFIGGTFNVTAHLAKKIWNAVREGRISDARAVQEELNDFIMTGLEASLTPFLREVLKQQGIQAGICRHPFGVLDERWKPVAKEAAAKLYG